MFFSACPLYRWAHQPIRRSHVDVDPSCHTNRKLICFTFVHVLLHLTELPHSHGAVTKEIVVPPEKRQNSVAFRIERLLFQVAYQLHVVTCSFLWFQHSFVGQPGLSRSLAVELLDKVNNPDNHTHCSEVDDDDFEVRASFIFWLWVKMLFKCLAFLSPCKTPT